MKAISSDVAHRAVPMGDPLHVGGKPAGRWRGLYKYSPSALRAPNLAEIVHDAAAGVMHIHQASQTGSGYAGNAAKLQALAAGSVVSINGAIYDVSSTVWHGYYLEANVTPLEAQPAGDYPVGFGT